MIDYKEYKESLLKQKETIREALLYTTDNDEVSELMIFLKCINFQLNSKKLNALS